MDSSARGNFVSNQIRIDSPIWVSKEHPISSSEVTIATTVARCISGLISVSEDEDKWKEGQVFISEVRDELSRFRVWAGNIGAHQTGRRSLDYRLRDASHIRLQVLQLLESLSDHLDDTRAILSGEKVPWERLPSDDEMLDEILSDEGGSESSIPDTKLSQILRNIYDIINCLSRLSVAIRNPAPHDRFRQSRETDTSYSEPYDIQHVREKCPTIDDYLAERLGRAISRWRQYFKYREAHHARFTGSLEMDTSKTEATSRSTIASSIPQALKTNIAFSVEDLEDDNQSDTGVSQTSYAASTANTDSLRVPKMPKEAQDGPFQCPFCYMMIVAKTRLAWK